MSKTQQPNIHLIGFMGAGKSAIGPKLAKHLELDFIDSDQFIERQQVRSCKNIITQSGLSYFRQLEKNFIDTHMPKTGYVVACGGGLVTIPGIIEKLKTQGILIYLKASPTTLYCRTQVDDHERPLLETENPLQTIHQLLKEREPFYHQAHIHISTDDKSIEEITKEIELAYESYAMPCQVCEPLYSEKQPLSIGHDLS